MKTHQIVGIGDLHLRSTSDRNAARMKALDQIVAEGCALPDLAAWLQLGDVFDSRSTVEDRNTFASYLLKMANHAPVVVVGGNHCAPGDLDVFGKIAARWPVYVVTTPRVLPVPLPTGRTALLACLPYPHRAGLVAAGAAASDVLQAGMQALDDVCRGLAMDLEKDCMHGWLPMFAAHVNVEGSLASNGQPSIGKELSITTGMLRRFGDIPKLLGHIHLPQEIGGAHYAGSIAPGDWGEIEGKRYLVLEWIEPVEDGWSFDAWRLISTPIDTPPMFHVEGTLSREAGFAWQVKKGPGGEVCDPPSTWVNCGVRVRYTFAASERTFLDDSVIRETFKDAARLEIEPIAVPDRGLRAPQVQAAKTIEEKLRAWGELNNTVVSTESMLAKLAALEHQDAAALLAEVTIQVATIENGHAAEEGTVAA